MTTRDRVRRHISGKAALFEESVIRRMTQVCLAHNGVNLAQGFPDFSTPPESPGAKTTRLAEVVHATRSLQTSLKRTRRRAMTSLWIWLTRDSERSRTNPISAIVRPSV